MPPSRPPSREEIDAAINRLTKLIAQDGQERREASGEVINQIGTLLGQDDPYLERERQRERFQAIIDALKPPRARRSMLSRAWNWLCGRD